DGRLQPPVFFLLALAVDRETTRSGRGIQGPTARFCRTTSAGHPWQEEHTPDMVWGMKTAKEPKSLQKLDADGDEDPGYRPEFPADASAEEMVERDEIQREIDVYLAR